MKLIICSILTILFIPSISFSQNRDLTKLKLQHAKYMAEINKANKLLISKNVSKHNTLNQLEIINSKIISQKDLVEAYKKEITLLNTQVDNKKDELSTFEQSIKELKSNYARLIIAADKMKKTNYNEFMLLFSSESFSEAYRRFQTLRQYSSYRKKQGELLNKNIHKKDSVLQVKETILNDRKNTYTKVSSGLKDMQKSATTKQHYISQLNSDEQWLKKTIKDNLKKSKKLEKEIEKLISKEAKSTTHVKVSDFVKYKGKLSWPVDNGVVTSYFGEHSHPTLKRIKVKNNGIDITTNKNNSVKAIFNGTVSRVIVIPGYNKAVIIRHGKYLTVYANLKDVNVKNGQSIVRRQKIGSIFSTSTDNNAILHFEIWEGSKKTNPLYWLYKR